MGNSEVGHLNLGAGRVVRQEITRIDQAIEDGSFFSNPALLSAFARAKSGGHVHLMGLVSGGGVHSDEHHYMALVEMARKQKIDPERLHVHVITDGRDTSPTGGLGYVERLQAKLSEAGIGKIATLCGRYWAMDRDERWERTERAYDLYTRGDGLRAEDALSAIKASYEGGTTDEFLEPTCLPPGKEHPIRCGDSIIWFNFRADRVRQIVRALIDDSFDGFIRKERPHAHTVTFLPYHGDFHIPTAFKRQQIVNSLGDWVCQQGLSQLRVAETEKYAHVTYFFSAGREEPFENETRILAPSPKDVATYDMKPSMNAREVAERTIQAIETGPPDLIVLNFANPDMVGHTGNFEAVVKAVETVDEQLGLLVEAVLSAGGCGIITADHGNAETLLQPDGVSPHTAHTTNPVPCILIGTEGPARSGGNLASIAPTLCKVLGIEAPREMTGSSVV